MNIERLVVSTLAGLLAAVVVDLDAWRKANGQGFDWKLAVGRWLKGAITGFLAGLTGQEIGV